MDVELGYVLGKATERHVPVPDLAPLADHRVERVCAGMPSRHPDIRAADQRVAEDIVEHAIFIVAAARLSIGRRRQRVPVQVRPAPRLGAAAVNEGLEAVLFVRPGVRLQDVDSVARQGRRRG